MIIYLCIMKCESNTPIYSKDIAQKPNIYVRDVNHTDVRIRVIHVLYGPHNKWRGIIKHHINKLTHSQSLMSEKMTFREVATRSPEAIKLSFELISHSLVSLSKLNDRQFMFFSHLWTHLEMLGTFNVSRTCPFNVLPVCAGLSGI